MPIRRPVLKRALGEALPAALWYLGRQIWKQIPGAADPMVSDLREPPNECRRLCRRIHHRIVHIGRQDAQCGLTDALPVCVLPRLQHGGERDQLGLAEPTVRRGAAG